MRGKEKFFNAAALETSGSHLSIAFLKKGRVIPGFHAPVSLRHESIFWKEFPKLLKKSGLRLADFNFLAATRGPGRFTGIRLGLAVAGTWSRSLQIPMFAPPVTELLQWQAKSPEGFPGRHLLIPEASSLLRFALGEPRKHWYSPGRLPAPLYLKESWK